MEIKKSVYLNMILNIMRTLLQVAFPLITYPYAARVLQVNNFGKVSFAQSIISYIALIAALGVNAYATREGGIYRKDSLKMQKFASEVFSFNLLTTLIAYFVLVILLIFNDTLRNNSVLLLILGLTVILTTISVDWLNVVYEDYLFITIRSFFIQCISLILLFVLVKNEDDYIKYALIQVVSSGTIAISNLVYTRKLCRIHFTTHINLKQHIKPIMILFSNSLAVSIYLNIDNVMLGFFKGEYYVGIYAVSVKVYSILKQVVASIYTVTVTRLTEYIVNEEYDQYKKLLNDVINNIIVIAIPVTIGLLCVADEIIYLLAGKEYITASSPLKILSVAIIFAVMGGALAYCINLPNQNEKINLISTVISAIVNMALNFIAIPVIGVNGAAFTTLASEVVVCIILVMTMKSHWNYFEGIHILSNSLKCFFAAIPFLVINYFIKDVFEIIGIKYLVVMVVLCISEYCIGGIILNNVYILRIIQNIKSKL